MVVTFRTEVTTRGQGDAAEVTGEVTRAVGDSGLARVTVTVFVVGSTAGVTTMEYEPGVVADPLPGVRLQRALRL